MDVQFSVINSRNLKINWTEPHDNNAPIITYNINYQNPDCLVNVNGIQKDVTVSNAEEHVMITNLHPGENYTFTVVAVNDICPSQPSKPASVQTVEEGIQYKTLYTSGSHYMHTYAIYQNFPLFY